MSRLLSANTADLIRFELADGSIATGTVQELRAETNQTVFISGVLSRPERGTFFFQKQTRSGVAGDYIGVVLFPESQRVFRLEPSGPTRSSELVERRLDEVLCIRFPRASAPAPSQVKPSALNPEQFPALPPPDYQQGIVALESLPGAAPVIYLDFAGGSYPYTWGGIPGPIPYARPNLNNAQIREIWCRVAQDFLAFNLNVTTDLQAYQRARQGSRQRVIITPTDTVSRFSGGAAYIGSFNWTGETPCWVFLITCRECAEACSHEAGHCLGLSHMGYLVNGINHEYFFGQGSGETSWAPIMGCGYYVNVTQWCKGEYLNANNHQDELMTIATCNDVAYRPDDTGAEVATCRYLEVYPDESAFAEGNIERTTDMDTFQFTTGGGAVSLRVNPAALSPDLAIMARLCDTNGTVMADSNPQDTLWASLTADLTAGTYLLQVSGAGRNNPLVDGFSSYGSLGYYAITGLVTHARLPDRFVVKEHANVGTIVGRVIPRITTNNLVTYTLTCRAGLSAFVIDSSGALSVADSTLLDYNQLISQTQLPVQVELLVSIVDLSNTSLTETDRRVVVSVLPSPPTIISGPEDVATAAGTTASLTVSATGASPITYQWLKNDIRLPEAVAQRLLLSHVTRHDSGQYEVVVSNPGGSVHSAPATVWVIAPQTLGTPTLLTDGSFSFLSQDLLRVPLEDNELSAFQIEVSSDLVTWVALELSPELKDGALVIVDPGARTNANRFYRVHEHRITP